MTCSWHASLPTTRLSSTRCRIATRATLLRAINASGASRRSICTLSSRVNSRCLRPLHPTFAPGQAKMCDRTSIASGRYSLASPHRRVKYSSRLPLPHRYVVPGGRFTEMYYWDSYFTMLGLKASGRARAAARHVRQLRLSDRALRPHPERQSHLLPESVATAVLRGDGRAAGRRIEGASAYSQISARRCRRNTTSGWKARTTERGQRASTRRTTVPTARYSIAIGTIARRRAKSRIAKTS